MKKFPFPSIGKKPNKMKMYLMLCFVFILNQLLMIGCSSTMQSVDVLKDLKPEAKMSLYTYELQQEHPAYVFGATGTANTLLNLTAIAGAEATNKANRSAVPYFTGLRKEMTRIYEDSLKNYRGFQYCPQEKLIVSQDGKFMPGDWVAKKNGLYACLSAKSNLLIPQGWKKKLAMTTTWNIMDTSGRNMKIETKAVSRDTYGLFPDLADTTFRPVWLGLAKENIKQFQKKFIEMMKAAKKIDQLNVISDRP